MKKISLCGGLWLAAVATVLGGELRNPADPEGWHEFPQIPGVSFRRARRIDGRGGGQQHVAQHGDERRGEGAARSLGGGVHAPPPPACCCYLCVIIAAAAAQGGGE